MKITNQILLVLLIIALLSTIFGIIIILGKLSTPSLLTGFATFDTGVVNVTIQSTIDINLINDNVDFGAGTIYAGGINTSVNTSDPDWGGGGNPNGFSNPGPFQVKNDGNADVIISVNSSNTAASFIGGTNPGYYFVGSHVGADEGCGGSDGFNITNNATLLGFTTSAQQICTNLTYADAADTVNISIFVDIPSDASIGLHTDSGFEVHATLA